MRFSDQLDRFSPYMLAVFRIATALLFMEHGTQKILGFPPGWFPQPPVFSLSGLAGILEMVGGVMLLIRLYTRAVAFILTGQMAVAYFIGHAPEGFFPVNNGGDAAILYCFLFLYLVFAGPGVWSIDGHHAHKRLRFDPNTVVPGVQCTRPCLSKRFVSVADPASALRKFQLACGAPP